MPFGLPTKKALMSYLHGYRQGVAGEGEQAVFLGIDGVPLRYAGLAQAIRRLGETGQVDRLQPHLFRPTFRVKRCSNTASCYHCRFYQTSPNQTMTQIIALHPEQSFRRRPGTWL